MKLLVIGEDEAPGFAESLSAEQIADGVEIIRPESLGDGLARLQTEQVDGVICCGPPPSLASVLLEQSGLLEQLPDGYCLLNLDLETLWVNSAFARFVRAVECGRPISSTETDVSRAGLAAGELLGRPVLDLMGDFEFLGPEFSPLQTALGLGHTIQSEVRLGEKSFCELHATPIFEGEPGLDLDSTQFRTADALSEMQGDAKYLLVSLHDVTAEILQRQKLNAIYSAGQDLGDLQPQEVLEMSVEERKDLLKSKILHYTEDLLQYETVEVRLYDEATGELKPLLAHGMKPDAETRQLFAATERYGVTGFVAATNKSYRCDDTERDPLYLSGAPGARSSLTVALVLHDQTLGTFNVESHEPGTFSDEDLQFLELFGREVAFALNTLELLAVEQSHSASESVRKILSGIAGPVDEVLNETAWILEKALDNEPEVAERLSRILEKTREVRRLVGQAADEGLSAGRPEGEALRGKRILVIDSDDAIRQSAHELLGRYGAFVETCHNGGEALAMARTAAYDVVITDIRPGDMGGTELLERLRTAHEDMPIILMNGYGYDPSHTLVNARSMGIRAAVFKPFKLDQILRVVGAAVSGDATDADERATPAV